MPETTDQLMNDARCIDKCIPDGMKLAVLISIFQQLLTNGTGGGSGSGVPSGVILMWSGTIATIPSGWALCNGANGTPDLRNQFIVAANADNAGKAMTTITGAPLQSGGANTHTHTNPNTGSSVATLGPGGRITDTSPAGDYDFQEAPPGHAHTVGNTGSATAIPTFFALAYIQKT